MNTILRTFVSTIMLAAGLFVFVVPAASAGKDMVYTGPFSNIAVQGYDPVAYFTEGEPVKGSKDFTMVYQGAEFRFANAENRAAFIADPEKYAPQYGGYCAWAVGNNYTAKGDARYWSIINGKLYLNYNGDVQNEWNKDSAGFIAKADENWPSVLE